jgi:hypothetical protein
MKRVSGPDPLLRDLQRTLKPLMAPASEKAELLVEHIAKRSRRKVAFEPKGLADAVRRLRSDFSDDEIREAAVSLVTHLSDLYDGRETVT